MYDFSARKYHQNLKEVVSNKALASLATVENVIYLHESAISER